MNCNARIIYLLFIFIVTTPFVWCDDSIQRTVLSAEEARENGIDIEFNEMKDQDGNRSLLCRVFLPEGNNIGQIYYITAELSIDGTSQYEFPISFKRYDGKLFTGYIRVPYDQIDNLKIHIQSSGYRQEEQSKVHIISAGDFLDSKSIESH